MSYKVADGVVESSSSTGDGALTLGGPPDGFFAFADKIGVSNRTVVEVVGTSGAAAGKRESLVVDVTASDTLTPVACLQSSDPGDAKIDWPAGNKVIKCAPLAFLQNSEAMWWGATEPLLRRQGSRWVSTAGSVPALQLYDGAQWLSFARIDPTSHLMVVDQRQGADIVAAATLDLGAVIGNAVTVTGSAAITALGTAPQGVAVTTRFTDAGAVLTHNAVSLILCGANLTVAAGDRFTWRSLGGGNWYLESYVLASGKVFAVDASALVSGTVAAARLPAASTAGAGIQQNADQAAMEAGTALRTVTADKQHFHPSAAKFWVMFRTNGVIDASFNVASITDNGTGDWTVNLTTAFSSATYAVVGVFRQTGRADIILQIGTQAAGSVQIIGCDATSNVKSEGGGDVDRVFVVGYGDQ